MAFNTIIVPAILVAACSTQVGAFPLDGPPQQNADGTCFAYLVKPGDYCDKIRLEHNIASVNSFNSWNAQTWAWNGCGGLQGWSVVVVRVCGILTLSSRLHDVSKFRQTTSSS